MAYSKQTWHDLPTQDTPISAARLSHIEDGIEAADTAAAAAVQTSDPRLSDSRTPKPHTHNASDINAGTLAAARMPTGYCTGSVNGTATNTTIWRGTAAQYAAIGSPDSNTIYFVKD